MTNRLAEIACAANPHDKLLLDTGVHPDSLYVEIVMGHASVGHDLLLTRETATTLRDALTQWLEARSNAQR